MLRGQHRRTASAAGVLPGGELSGGMPDVPVTEGWFASSRDVGAALLLVAFTACRTNGAGRASDAGAPFPPASAASAPSLAPRPSSDSRAVLPPTIPAPPLSPRRAAALADDLRAHLAAAQSGLHPPPRVRTVAGTVVVAAADPSIPLDRAVNIADETQAALYDGPFQHRPDRAITLFLFSSRTAYAKAVHARAAGAPEHGYGLYDPRTREAFVCTQGASIDSAAHELTHALLLDDFPRAPHWLQEGVASLFELPDFSRPGQIHGKAHFRLQTLRDALRRPATTPLVRLDALFEMTPEDFDASRDPLAYLHFAIAREAMRWMDSQHDLWPFYGAFRDGVLTDSTGEKAFERVVGKSPSDATADWLKWIASVDSESP